AASVGNHSLAGEFTGVPRLTGASQPPAALRSTYQMSMSVRVSPGARGRSEMKYRRRPSLAKNGSASRYWPENGATVGGCQRPPSKRENTMVQYVNAALLFTKKSPCPSGVKAGCDSKSPDEISPGANSVGRFNGAADAHAGCSARSLRSRVGKANVAPS